MYNTIIDTKIERLFKLLIWNKFKQNITENKLVTVGDKILLAVSGGPDSVVMTDLFYKLQKIFKLELVIVNFNHKLRKESSKETELVANLAKQYKIKFISKIIATKKYASSNKISIEAAGRQLRYKYLEEIAKENKCNKIATAHNMNDNAETVLMWLIRGTGTNGLSGIPYERKICKNLSIIRPLLSIDRTLIEEHIKKNNIKFSVDKSNFSFDYTRNKIRLGIIPELKKINPLVIEHIYELSKIIYKQNLYLESKIKIFVTNNVKKQKNKIVLNFKSFLKKDSFLQYAVLREILPDKKRAIQIKSILKFINDKKQLHYKLSKYWSVTKTKQNIVFKNNFVLDKINKKQ